MRHSTIHFGENTVTKTAAPNLMRIEVEKTRRAYEIGKSCGLFRVPEILDYDETKGQVVFERIERIQPIIHVQNQWKSVMERIGRSLAIIHRTLSLPQEMAIPLPSEFALPGTEVFLHGDFNGFNICIDTCSLSIVILDWQMTPRHGGQATYGSRYFDLLWFVNCILWSPTVRYLFYDPVTPAAKSLFRSYFSEAKTPCNTEMLLLYTKQFFNILRPLRKQRASRRIYYLLPRSYVLTQRFTESIKTIVPESSSHSSRNGAKDAMTVDYRKSHLEPEKGKTYHNAFSSDPHRNMVWQFEKAILDHILLTFYRNTAIHHLDFACGTGRILAYLKDRTKSSVGVDLSASMLEVARKNNKSAEIIEADLTKEDVLHERKFNLITAFRFFPNAQKELRIEALQVLTRHLEKNGYIVFNNHKHTGSTRNRLARLLGRGGYLGMSLAEVEELLSETGLEVSKIYHLSVFPASEKRRLLPISLLRQIEALLSKCSFCQDFGENLIFVCRRSEMRQRD